MPNTQLHNNDNNTLMIVLSLLPHLSFLGWQSDVEAIGRGNMCACAWPCHDRTSWGWRITCMVRSGL